MHPGDVNPNPMPSLGVSQEVKAAEPVVFPSHSTSKCNSVCSSNLPGWDHSQPSKAGLTTKPA